MRALFLFLVLALATTPALAETPLDADQFDSATRGDTITYDYGNGLFGTEDDSDLVVVGWYPDRGALLRLLRDPEYRAAFEHRRAAVASEWVVATDAAA